MPSQSGNRSEGLESISSSELLGIATLESSHRLTPSISLHCFSITNSKGLLKTPQPAQHVTLQFPESLDLIYGSRFLKDEDRCLTFTPCSFQYGEGESEFDSISMSVITRNGRITSLLGIPRPQAPLSAKILASGSGFSVWPEDLNRGATFVAGGTGIATFLTIADERWRSKSCDKRLSLLWSINRDDFALVEHLIKEKILESSDWQTIVIFVTDGGNHDGLVAEKPRSWWEQKINDFRKGPGFDFGINYRRLEKSDLENAMLENDYSVFFCGSKSLEWQIRMWCLNRCQVYTPNLP